MPFRYSRAARTLHWLTALLVLVLFVAGLWIVYFEPKGNEWLTHRLYLTHESTGFVLFLLVLVRLAMRITRPPAPLPIEVPPAMRLAASANHVLLYAVLLGQATVGFLNANAAGAPLILFDRWRIPSPIGKDEAWGTILSNLHVAGAILLIALIALHVGGAAWHGLVRRDGIISRMI